jgi:hypothetical protein
VALSISTYSRRAIHTSKIGFGSGALIDQKISRLLQAIQANTYYSAWFIELTGGVHFGATAHHLNKTDETKEFD